jgi:hypothetical protein
MGNPGHGFKAPPLGPPGAFSVKVRLREPGAAISSARAALPVGLGEPKTLNAGDGLLIASGATLELKAAGGAPSALLQFLPSPGS